MASFSIFLRGGGGGGGGRIFTSFLKKKKSEVNSPYHLIRYA
jgi:hypothetical protein